MSLTDFLKSIGAPPGNAGVTDAEIIKADTRLGGRLPDALRAWFREANGFDGEAETCMWRFKSLHRLHSIPKIFPAAQVITVSRNGDPDRRMAGYEYVIFCDALIYLPFYAVNIRFDSPHYSEIVRATEEAPSVADFVAPSFERFTDILFQHYDDGLLIAEDRPTC